MTKIGTEAAHVIRDKDTTFKVKRSKVNLQGRGHTVAAFRTACFSNKKVAGRSAGNKHTRCRDAAENNSEKYNM